MHMHNSDQECSTPINFHFFIIALKIASDRNIHSTVTDKLNVETLMNVWIGRATVGINT